MIEISSILFLLLTVFSIWKNEKSYNKNKIPFDILKKDKS